MGRRAVSLVFCLVLAAMAAQAAAVPGDKGVLKIGRFSLSLGVGSAAFMGAPGMLDLKTELQYELSSRIRIGLGVGYMTSFGNPGSIHARHYSSDPLLNGLTESGPPLRAVPLSLSVYYLLPLGPHWSIFASGGGSYYLAGFQGMSGPARRGLFGGQGGLGIEYHLSSKLSLFAQGNYSLLDVRGLSKMRVGDFPPGDGVWDPAGYLKSGLRSPGLNLRGFSIRIGFRINL